MSDAVWMFGALALILEITLANRDALRQASMEPPVLGALHFNDGYILSYTQPGPDEAIQYLIDSARRPSAYLPPWKGSTRVEGMADDC